MRTTNHTLTEHAMFEVEVYQPNNRRWIPLFASGSESHAMSVFRSYGGRVRVRQGEDVLATAGTFDPEG